MAVISFSFTLFGFTTLSIEIDLAVICYLKNCTVARTGYIFLQTPDGQTNLELIKYYRPSDAEGIQQSFANTLGIRHIAFVVEDIEAVVAKLKKKGIEPFGEIYSYQDSYKLCYVRGPEGIILELAEQIK